MSDDRENARSEASKKIWWRDNGIVVWIALAIVLGLLFASSR